MTPEENEPSRLELVFDWTILIGVVLFLLALSYMLLGWMITDGPTYDADICETKINVGEQQFTSATLGDLV